MEKNCQSCGMPLIKKNQSQQGTEKDQSLSWNYCQLCYAEGTFIEPEMTMTEMLAIGTKAIQNGSGSSLIKKFMSWGYPYQLKRLKRWQ